MQPVKLLEDILNSEASLGPDASLLMFGEMLKRSEEYHVYMSHLQPETKALAEQYINNDAWVIFDDMKYQTVDPAHVAIVEGEKMSIHGLVYQNGAVWILDRETVLLHVLNETAVENDYPKPL